MSADLPTLPWRCTLPLPPSINQAKTMGLVHGQHRIVKTHELLAWEKEADRLLGGFRPPRLLANHALLFVFRFWMPSAASDWDGRPKYAQDAVARWLGRPLPGDPIRMRTVARGPRRGERVIETPRTFDDRDVAQALVDKKVDRANPRLELTIRWGDPHLVDAIEAWLDALPVNDFGVPLPLPAVGQRAQLWRAIGDAD